MAELAQVNVALMRAPLRHRQMRGFAEAFERVARLAEDSPGFVWHLRLDTAPVVRDPDGDQVVNVSVWRDYPSLHAYVYGGAHAELLRRRADWFLPTPQPSTALWWQPDGHRPDLPEALDRLRQVRGKGATPTAFTLREQFTPEGVAVRAGDVLRR